MAEEIECNKNYIYLGHICNIQYQKVQRRMCSTAAQR